MAESLDLANSIGSFVSTVILPIVAGAWFVFWVFLKSKLVTKSDFEVTKVELNNMIKTTFALFAGEEDNKHRAFLSHADFERNQLICQNHYNFRFDQVNKDLTDMQKRTDENVGELKQMIRDLHNDIKNDSK
jgi:hypothetical protein